MESTKRFFTNLELTSSTMQNNQSNIAFVGSLVPDVSEHHNSAFSRAGNQFQINLIKSLISNSVNITKVVSFLPIPSYPASDTVLVNGRSLQIDGVGLVDCVGYLNIKLFKQVLIGINICLRLSKWWLKGPRNHSYMVYMYNLSVPPGAIIFGFCKIFGIKLVASLNDINVPGSTIANNFYSTIDYWQQKLVIPRLDGRVAVCDKMMYDLAKNSHYIRVEGGIEPEIFRVTSIHKPREDKFTILTAGLLYDLNGINEILNAFKMLIGEKYELIIAGTGPLLSTVLDAAKSDKRIQYVGFIEFGELLKLYQKANLLICMRPTKNIKTDYFFPSKILEYLASGTPTLTTNTGHIGAEFKDFCFILEDESAEGLGKMICKIEEMPREYLNALGIKARNFLLQQKSWFNQGERISKYIKSLNK